MTPAKLSHNLRTALMETGLVMPVSHGDSLRHFWVLTRLTPGQEPAWMDAVQNILIQTGHLSIDGEVPDVIVSRRYVLKDGKMVFGWYLSVVAKKQSTLVGTVEKIIEVLRTAKAGLIDVDDPVPSPERQSPLRLAAPVQSRVLAPGQHPKRAVAPRPPGVGSPREPPAGHQVSIRIVKRDIDTGGQPVVIEEMPLPHTYRDLNVPNAKGKGATLTSQTERRR